MLLAIRLLTLVTFTAHAVLGCCLTHGSCMREQAVVLNDDCGDHHDHECDSHKANEEQNHEHHSNETRLCFDGYYFADIAEKHDHSEHDHSEHCNDGICVFGLADPATLSDMKVVSAASWNQLSARYSIAITRHVIEFVDLLRGPPSGPHIRALLQVWTI